MHAQAAPRTSCFRLHGLFSTRSTPRSTADVLERAWGQARANRGAAGIEIWWRVL
jgi:hypothetical protein